MTRLEETTYYADGGVLFAAIRDLPHAVYFDSSHPHSDRGRFDIMSAGPWDAGLEALAANASAADCRSYLDKLEHFHREHYAGIQPIAPDIPFCGGILGYLGYGLGSGLQALTPRVPAKLPIAQLYAYDWAIIQDHLLQRAVLVWQDRVNAARRNDIRSRLRNLKVLPPEPFRLRSPFAANFTEADYRDAFANIQAYIRAGDCYQVNLSQCFTAYYSGDPWHAYRALREVAAAPFSAYLQSDADQAILCLSPERFISLQGRHVETSPIKGTRPRYQDTAQDRAAAKELRDSAKDRAENLMIVDLLRNDLGRFCSAGSIHVDRLFELQSFNTVHHLVSTISGELQPDRTAWDIVRESFPGGSITGAPKKRAMEIIDELESMPRDIYCGSLVYISADGRMDSNIAIRTLACDAGRIRCWGGGGIVADSDGAREYRETYDKVGRFLSALEDLGEALAPC